MDSSEMYGTNPAQHLSVALLTLFLSNAYADEITGRDLLNQCLSGDTFLHEMCKSYVLGIYEGVLAADGAVMSAGKFVKERKSTIICPPNAINIGMIISTFIAVGKKLAETYPSDLDEPATSIVVVALGTTFPCR